MNQLRIFASRHELLKLSIRFQTAFGAGTHSAEGQCLKEQLNMLTLCMVRFGAAIPTVSRAECQHLVPVKTLIRNQAFK
jgi:hypothetical protein